MSRKVYLLLGLVSSTVFAQELEAIAPVGIDIAPIRIESAPHQVQLRKEERARRMANLLKENKIPPMGKRWHQRADLTCELISSRKYEGPRCLIVQPDFKFIGTSGPALPVLVEDNRVTGTLYGAEAEEAMELLLEFGVKPKGESREQHLEVFCEISSKKNGSNFGCHRVASSPLE